MSYNVDVTLDDAEKNLEKLDSEFKKIHDQNFEIDCNFDLQKGTHERHKCDHGIYLIPKHKKPKPFKFTHLNIATNKAKEVIYTQPPDFKAFITIPCHWDYDHMAQTEKDIQEAARKLDLQITTRKSW